MVKSTIQINFGPFQRLYTASSFLETLGYLASQYFQVLMTLKKTSDSVLFLKVCVRRVKISSFRSHIGSNKNYWIKLWSNFVNAIVIEARTERCPAIKVRRKPLASKFCTKNSSRSDKKLSLKCSDMSRYHCRFFSLFHSKAVGE